MTLENTLTLPWDIAILIMLSCSFGMAYAAFRWLLTSRNKAWWMRTGVMLAGVVSAIFFGLIAYGSFIEPSLITVTRVQIPFPMRSSVNIAVISDLHVGPYKGARYIERVVRRINAELPDAVIIAGDLILTEELGPQNLRDLEPLKNLRPALGTFAILGNHDHGVYRLFSPGQYRPPDRSDVLAERLRSFGLIVLENAQSEIRIGDDAFRIAGIEDALSGEADIVQTLRDVNENSPVILVSHNPDIILDPLSKLASIIVSGHTHGGQIRIPGYGPISALPTQIGRKYDQGIFALDSDTTLAITRGVGESGPRARLFAPPEIMMIETLPRK